MTVTNVTVVHLWVAAAVSLRPLSSQFGTFSQNQKHTTPEGKLALSWVTSCLLPDIHAALRCVVLCCALLRLAAWR
jgi:hypothetical protein